MNWKHSRAFWCCLSLILAVFLTGCSDEPSDGDENATKPNGAGAANSSSGEGGEYRVVEVTGGATLQGVIRFTGTAPKQTKVTVDRDKEACGKHDILFEKLQVSQDGGVRNAVVWLQDVRQGKAWPEGETVMDQEGCVFKPHVVVVGAGRPLKFKNADPVLHNVKTFGRENVSLNFTLRAGGKGRPIRKKIKFPDEVKAACDFHKWMNAWIIVRDNPYFAITDESGAYTIGKIPAGTYKIVVWHESLAKVEKTVTLKDGKALVENVEMESK